MLDDDDDDENDDSERMNLYNLKQIQFIAI